MSTTNHPPQNGTSQATQDSAQICPHETLSLEPLQRFAHLPNFKMSHKKICALTHEHHLQGYDTLSSAAKYSCEPLGHNVSNGIITSLLADATFSWHFYSGICLSLDWKMGYVDSSKVKSYSPTDLQHILETTNIQLCPHMKISDQSVVKRIYGIINPLGFTVDPIESYLMKETDEHCDSCETRTEVKMTDDNICCVKTIRVFGKAERKDDTVWIAQCTSS